MMTAAEWTFRYGLLLAIVQARPWAEACEDWRRVAEPMTPEAWDGFDGHQQMMILAHAQELYEGMIA